jgi:hypothetical protein
MKERRLFAAASTVLIAAIAVAGATATRGAEAVPTAFRLVFEGKHNAELLHEGPFTTSASFCPSGLAADVDLDSSTESSLRRFSCGGSKGDFSARVSPLPAEHGGIGVWQIVAGTGPLADLRGKGTWTSTRVSGRPDDPATITFRSTWDGVADFDVAPPTIAVSSSSARKLRRPKGTYALRVVLALTDAGGSDPVSYVLQIVDSRAQRHVLAYKSGNTTSGSAALSLRVRPAKSTRVLRLAIDGEDALGNATTFVKNLKIR